jgi:uncharacterized membrane protein
VQAGQFALFALSFAAAWLTAHHNLSENDLRRWTLIISLLGIGTMLVEVLFGYYGLRARGMTGSVKTWAWCWSGAAAV